MPCFRTTGYHVPNPEREISRAEKSALLFLIGMLIVSWMGCSMGKGRGPSFVVASFQVDPDFS